MLDIMGGELQLDILNFITEVSKGGSKMSWILSSTHIVLSDAIKRVKGESYHSGDFNDVEDSSKSVGLRAVERSAEELADGVPVEGLADGVPAEGLTDGSSAEGLMDGKQKY